MRVLKNILFRFARYGVIKTTFIALLFAFFSKGNVKAEVVAVEGVHIVPHTQSHEMRYRKPTDFSLGARVEVFLRNKSSKSLFIKPTLDVKLRGKSPHQHIKSDEWAWHSFPSAWGDDGMEIQPNAITVWSWNGKRAEWGVSTETDLTLNFADGQGIEKHDIKIKKPSAWLSAVTFLGEPENPQPDSFIFHIVNESTKPLRILDCRLWLPQSNASWNSLIAQPWNKDSLEIFPSDGWVIPGGRGGARVFTRPLPLTYCALEVKLANASGKTVSLWAHQRIKREVFDIGGGWLAEKLGNKNTLQAEDYLRTLARMHVNAGMHQQIAGYSGTALFDQYPLKYTNKLQPIEHYDTDELLPHIHAVEFLGEPQYGGGTPVPPQEVWKAFTPYAETRLPTSITHSEERIWRFYASISDYPHYDAYRINAPAADSWKSYDRWGGKSIRWGAPLETIGTMTRSLRELNRPRPIAYWSQGAHSWGRYFGRKRNSPSPDELRAQAYHGLAARITSLYWFNLSLKSLIQFRDLIDPITEISRQSLVMASLLIEGDAFEHKRKEVDGKPDWDLSSITGPEGGVLFAIDLDYEINDKKDQFEFKSRKGNFQFKLPTYLLSPVEVFSLKKDHLADVEYEVRSDQIIIKDEVHIAGIYLISPIKGLRQRINHRLIKLLNREQKLEFDPAVSDKDFQSLKNLLFDDSREAL